MWFTEDTSNLGRIAPDGAISEYPVPYPGRPWGIATGTDGNVWFTDLTTSQVGKVSPCGVVTEYTVSGPPSFITPATDGNMWFSIPAIKIGRITPAGSVREFPVNVGAESLVGAADGNVWFLINNGADFPPDVGSISPSGVVKRYPVGGPARGLAGLTVAGNTLWFSDGKLYRVGRVSLNGTITEYALPWGDVTPSVLASGPDGRLWIVDASGRRIVHLIPPA
jgi:virginiamycin B lyase